MASNLEFVQYVCDQMKEAGKITYLKMFGDYGIYCNGKIVGLICDDQLFLKKTESAQLQLREIVERPPYSGAKPYFFIEDIEDCQYLSKLVRLTYDELPEPKPKKPRKPKNSI